MVDDRAEFGASQQTTTVYSIGEWNDENEDCIDG